MKKYEAELVLDCKCLLGEGPVWDEKNGSLLWTDITKSELHRYYPASGEHRVIATEQSVGCFALRSINEGAIAAGVGGIYWLDVDTGAMDSISNPEQHIPGSRFNDGKCDSQGRFLAGTMTADGKPNGAFYTIDRSLQINWNFGEIVCSNGITWSLDEHILYYIDSLSLSVVAYEYDGQTGRIGQGNTIISFPEGQCLPDGMTSDSEGMLWIAEWGGGQVSRWNPHTGELLAIVSVPCKFVTSCAFAGKDSEVLYITTASNKNDDETIPAGGLFRVTTDTTGWVTYNFDD